MTPHSQPPLVDKSTLMMRHIHLRALDLELGATESITPFDEFSKTILK